MSDTLTKIGRYEIRGTLGAGAMGVVYRGWDTRLEQEVAVKVLIPGSDAANHPEEIKRFLREVKISRTLKHPNIVSVYDVDDDSATGRTFIVMELVNGKPLNALLKEKTLTFRERVLSGVRYLSVLPTQSPIDLGRDGNERHLLACNFEVVKEPS